MIAEEVVRRVRESTDLVRLIGEYIPLRRQGANWVARCPFHEERSPSFNVNGQRGFYFCFGCKAAGDAFSFLSAHEGLDFPEAVRRLGDRLGIEVEPEADPAVVAEQRRARDGRARLLAVCEAAAAFYEAQLAADGPGPAAARTEIARRALPEETVAAFRLGYAPAAWSDLARHLAAEGHSPADAELAGLLLGNKAGAGFHDRFRHRLVCPVMDREGRVVAYSARTLGPAPEGAPSGVVSEEAGKYVNSPETPLFRKGEHLYGLWQGRAPLRLKPEAVLVEGNFDVMQAHARGFPRTVAPLGTAFTLDQARLLRRFAESVTLLFDGDAAGRKAVPPAHEATEAAGMVVTVGVLPHGQDPDAFLRQPDGPAAFARVIDEAASALTWLIDEAAARAGDVEARRVAALRALAPALAAVTDDIERGLYLRHAGERLRIPRELATRAVADAMRARAAAREAAGGPAAPAARPDADGQLRPPAEQVARASLVPPPADPGEAVEGAAAAAALRKAFAAAVTAMLAAPEVLDGPAADLLAALSPPAWRPLVEAAAAQRRARGEFDGPALLDLAPDLPGARAWVAQRLMADLAADEAEVARRGAAHREQFAGAVKALDRADRRTREREDVRAGAAAITGGDAAGGIDAINAVLHQRRAALSDPPLRAPPKERP